MACHTGEYRSCSLLNSSNAFPSWKSKIHPVVPRGSRSWKFHAEYFQTLWQKSTSFVYRSLHFSRAFCIWYRYNVGIGSSLSKTKQKKNTHARKCATCAPLSHVADVAARWDGIFFFHRWWPKNLEETPRKISSMEPQKWSNLEDDFPFSWVVFF